MERLKYHSVYISGAIDNVSHEEAIGWRQDITPFLQSLGLFVFDPTNKCVDGYEEDEKFFERKKKLKQDGKYKELHELGKPIRSLDLRFVDLSSFVIAYLDLDVILTGTLNEIFMCDSQRKPCLIVCKQGVESIADWLFFTFPSEFFFSNFDDLKKYITGIHDGSITELHNRWHLIDYGRILPPQLRPTPQLNRTKQEDQKLFAALVAQR